MASPPCHILVIDDSPDLRQLFDTFLTEEGYRVNCAPSDEAAGELLRTTRPDLIICDLHLGWLPDFGILALLDAEEKHHGIPVLICTGGDPRTVDPALAAFQRPATAVLYKPFDLDDLLAAIARLTARSTDPGARSPGGPSTPLADTIVPCDAALAHHEIRLTALLALTHDMAQSMNDLVEDPLAQPTPTTDAFAAMTNELPAREAELEAVTGDPTDAHAHLHAIERQPGDGFVLAHASPDHAHGHSS